MNAWRTLGWWAASVLVLAGAAAASDLQLVEAVKSQDARAAAALIKQRVDVNQPQADGATALHWASYWDDVNTASLLIRAGANVNAANELGVTPLYLAAANGSAPMVQTLLAAGARTNLAPGREPPLMLAARAGSVTAVRALLAGGADVNAQEPLRGQTALMWAIAQKHAEVVAALLEGGANVNARSGTSRLLVNRGAAVSRNAEAPPSVGEVELGGSTPILFAARHGDIQSARLLLEAGANLNDTAPDGNSVLIRATHSGHSELARLLIDKGADVNASGPGYTALHTAVLTGAVDLVRSLLAHGANPDAALTRGTPVRRTGEDLILPETLLGATPFFLAAKFVDVPLMKVLLEGGADPAIPLQNGTTPLMAAAGLGWSGSTNRRGIDVTAKKAAIDPNDDEPHTLAAVKFLLDLGADVNGANQGGDTALFGAVPKGFTSVVQLLADRGARLDAKNGRGQTLLELAVPRLTGAADTPADLLIATGELLRKLGTTP
jgi:ankyrin repeat protein